MTNQLNTATINMYKRRAVSAVLKERKKISDNREEISGSNTSFRVPSTLGPQGHKVPLEPNLSLILSTKAEN
jgi:hypothetical protein